MKFAAWKLGFRINEVPIIFEDRKFGSSKMNKGIIKEGILGVLNLRWQSLFKNYRNRVKKTTSLQIHPYNKEVMVGGE
jgi:dolichol-phosphate mannosyltransferase